MEAILRNGITSKEQLDAMAMVAFVSVMSALTPGYVPAADSLSSEIKGYFLPVQKDAAKKLQYAKEFFRGYFKI